MKRAAALFSFSIVFSLAILAQAVIPPPDITDEKLPNGLDVVVAENHASPFVRIDLAFKTGAISQTSHDAGSFHLLEHTLLLAKGDGISTEDSLGKIGVLDWKAETGAEYLDFDMKLPSAQINDGMTIWSTMIARDTFDQSTVDEAKKQTESEATAQTSDPAAVYEAAMTKRVFARFPWRRDPIGDAKILESQDAESLANLKGIWLVPSNAVLIVVGDVKPGDVFADAQAAFGSWKSAPSPWTAQFQPQPKLGVMRPTWFAIADPRIPEGLAVAEIRYRGPDLESDPHGVFVADLWADMASAPDGRFEKAAAAALPSLHGPVLVQFLSQRDGSVISVSAPIDLDGKTPAFRDAEALKEAFRGSEVMEMKIDPSYFTAEEMDSAKADMIATREKTLDTIDGMDSELRFAWCSASKEWFLGWNAGIEAVNKEEISDFLTDWILHNLEVVAIRINPTDMEKIVSTLGDNGFEHATVDNSFWWQDR